MRTVTAKSKALVLLGLGFVLASLVPAVAFALATPIHRGRLSVDQLGIVPVFLVFSFAAVALIGLPIYFLLRRMQLVTWWPSLLAGGVAGVIVTFAVRLPSLPLLNDFIFTCPVAALSAFIFWLTLRLDGAEMK